jgi:ABC transport system ATP-binding/permease protein
MPILTADDLSKSFGSRTLFDGVSLSIEDNEKIGFIGPNGSGKSTLFSILAGMEPADRGTVAIRRGASVGRWRRSRNSSPA